MALLIWMGYGDTDTATRRRTARNITLSKPSYTEQSEGKRGSSVSRNGNRLLESYFTCSGTTNFGACVDAVLLFLHTCLRTTSFFVNEMSLNHLWMHSSIYLNSIPYVRLTINALAHIYNLGNLRITASKWFYLWHGSQAINPSLYDLCDINSIGLSVYITFMNHPSCSLRYILLCVKKIGG